MKVLGTWADAIPDTAVYVVLAVPVLLILVIVVCAYRLMIGKEPKE